MILAASDRHHCCCLQQWMIRSGHGFAPASLPRQAHGYRLSRFHPWAWGWTMTSSGWRWVCGTHGLACKRSAGRHPRHGLLNDVVWRAMLRAQVPSCKEPAGLSRSDGKRPDGVSLIPWSRGRCVTWDVTSPDTLAPTHLPLSATQAGAAAARAEAAKSLKYSALATTHVFVPLAFETLGVWRVEAVAFVAELGKRMTAVTGNPERRRFSVSVSRLRFSVATPLLAGARYRGIVVC